MDVKKINLGGSVTDYRKYYDPARPFFIAETACRAEGDDSPAFRNGVARLLAVGLVLDGKGSIEINGSRYELKKDTLFFIPKNSRFRISGDGSLFTDRILLDGEMAHKLVEWYLPSEPYAMQAGNAAYLFSGIRDLAETYADNYDEFLKYATLLFCSFMTDLNFRLTSADSGDVAHMVKLIIDYSSEEKLSVKDIADRLHYSVNYIIRAFRKEFGCTPAKYYAKRKIDVAMLFLRTGDASIGEISDRLHFVDQHYFSKAFKRETGSTPSEYRDSFRS